MAVDEKPKYVEFIDVDLHKLESANENVRLRLDTKTISRIAETFKHYGLIQPIVVDENLNVIVGSQRLEALKKAGVNKVKVLKISTLKIPLAIQVEGLDSIKKQVISAIENQIRSPLNIEEQQLFLRNLIQSLQEKGYTRQGIVQELKKINPEITEEILAMEFPDLFPEEKIEIIEEEEEEEEEKPFAEEFREEGKKKLEGVVITKPKIKTKETPPTPTEEAPTEEEEIVPSEFPAIKRALSLYIMYEEDDYNNEVLPVINSVGMKGLMEFVRKCIKYYEKVKEFLESLDEA